MGKLSDLEALALTALQSGRVATPEGLAKLLRISPSEAVALLDVLERRGLVVSSLEH